ncbi:MAG: carbon-nitrogen hydrolase family protein [Gammaproteobacteria bacterium]|nr:MAG: carbon-nitrogen hydrolase family protein [Gammaproteobacteria bacterium]
MVSGADPEANLESARQLIAKAADAGARLVVLPENFALMGHREEDKLAFAEREGDGPLQAFLSRQAERHNLWLVGGTLPLADDAPERVRAACLVYDDHGQQVARYDKIHLFDVEVAATGERYAESETIAPGDTPVVIDTPLGRLGLAVCYDLRFPELFRALVDDGMELLALPAAFTATTGRAHWETLLRARAIENLCYVVASAQGGTHPDQRETHGESMVIDPWGMVIDRLATGVGVAQAPFDRDLLEGTRRTFPALAHRHTLGNL